MKFDKEQFIDYLENMMNLDTFSRRLVESVIDYGLAHNDVTQNQLAYFLYDTIGVAEPKITFEKIKSFYED